MDKSYASELSNTIAARLRAMNVPGAAVGVVDGGEIAFLQAFGHADLENGVAMSVSSVLPIGSATKAFAAAAVMLLADDGKLDPDKPVRDYLPEFSLADPVASREATTRDLLCHRSGLPARNDAWLRRPGLRMEKTAFELLRDIEPSMAFRGGWQYNNMTYSVIGCLIERVSNMSWEDFVTARILTPLGMDGVSFSSAPRDGVKLYTPDENGINRESEPVDFSAVAPAGCMSASINDMMKWLKFNISGGKPLLSGASFRELFKPNVPFRFRPFSFDEIRPVGYALGWMIYDYRGRRLAEHPGNAPGASAYVAFLPDDGVGFAALTNGDCRFFGEALAATVFDRYLGASPEKDWFKAYTQKRAEVAREAPAAR